MEHAELQTRITVWARKCRPFCRPNAYRASYQLVTTLSAYILTVAVAIVCAVYHMHLVVVPCVIVASGLMVRLFILQHDCGHGSYLPGKKLNSAIGHMLSMFTFVPYQVWKDEHAKHHAGSGNLARRGVGDIDLLTVREYQALSEIEKIWYRIMRNPIFLMLIGGPVYFLILNRVPWGRGIPLRDSWHNILALDIAMVIVIGVLSLIAGANIVVPIVALIAYTASGIGVWLFYVQHQFEMTQWYDGNTWDFHVAAVYGSSYYKLPRLLAWFTGDIGIHHVHHLLIRIPNYNLRACLQAVPELAEVNPLTFWESVRHTGLMLWDEDRRELVRVP